MLELMRYADSIVSLIPPLLTILLAVITREILFSLIVGIVVSALMLTQFHLSETLYYLGATIWSLFYIDHGWQLDKLFILSFLLFLGMMTALITANGSSQAFALAVKRKIRNKKEAQLATIFLGFVVFIDDYFNSLVVGNIARPITDRYYISRAKLAYLLDSTAAPICVLAPISSWGAYIIALIGAVFMSHGLTEQSYLGVFIQMIPMNFYALFALLFLILVVIFEIDLGLMFKHEVNAQKGLLFDETKGEPMGMNAEIEPDHRGTSAGLLIPIILLSVTTLLMIGLTGYQAISARGLSFTWIHLVEHADIYFSLFIGGLTGLGTVIMLSLRQQVSVRHMSQACYLGLRSMLPAVCILLVAWMMAHMIEALGSGLYMANLMVGYLPAYALPAVIFVVAGLTAFATGTSFATFAIMLPIAVELALGSHTALMLPLMAAVLAGAVCGDHCSPISDTTILSSTGAGCHHMDHVLTQLPYTLVVAGISLVGFLVLGITYSVGWSLLCCLGLTISTIIWLRLERQRAVRHSLCL
jgi:tetracycline resistance efflux pump